MHSSSIIACCCFSDTFFPPTFHVPRLCPSFIPLVQHSGSSLPQHSFARSNRVHLSSSRMGGRPAGLIKESLFATMGGSSPPFLYGPPASHSFYGPTDRPFNPKVVTQASWTRPAPKPKPKGPLINFNRHPDSVSGGGYLGLGAIGTR